MSQEHIEKHSLLRDGGNDSDSDSADSIPDANTRACRSSQRPFSIQWTRSRRTNISSVVVFVSVTTNLILGIMLALMAYRSCSSTYTESQETVTNHSEISPYASLNWDPIARFPYSVGYGPEVTNHTLADIRWESIDIDPGTVAIDNEWAAAHNLVPTQPFPWDSSKSIYYISAFHTIHCLKGIHRIVYDAHHGRPPSRDIGHAMHCIDHIRKEAMCNADDYLLPTPPVVHGHIGLQGQQSRVCRNWDKLVEWANEHHACYQHITDDEEGFAKSHKEIERYAACPPDSPYRTAMEAYFARHGIDAADLVREKPVGE